MEKELKLTRLRDVVYYHCKKLKGDKCTCGEMDDMERDIKVYIKNLLDALDVIDANSNKDGLARYKEEDTSSYTGMPIYSKGESQRFQPHSNPILASKGYMEVSNSPNAKEYLKSNTSKGFYRNGKRVDQVYWFPKDALTKPK